MRDGNHLRTDPRMIIVRFRKTPSIRSPFPSRLAVCLAVLSMTVQAFGADQVDGKRHSLILRPVAEHERPMAPGLSLEAQTGIRAAVSPATSSTSASPPPRLAKHPEVLSNTSQGTSMAAVASTKAGHQPVANVRPAQPIAANGTETSSRYRGSRAVMNLPNISGLVNLLQAPLPPRGHLVAQSSGPSQAGASDGPRHLFSSTFSSTSQHDTDQSSAEPFLRQSSSRHSDR